MSGSAFFGAGRRRRLRPLDRLHAALDLAHRPLLVGGLPRQRLGLRGRQRQQRARVAHLDGGALRPACGSARAARAGAAGC
jgi:hypothetical protein